jgi:hypothetical protein
MRIPVSVWLELCCLQTKLMAVGINSMANWSQIGGNEDDGGYDCSKIDYNRSIFQCLYEDINQAAKKCIR